MRVWLELNNTFIPAIMDKEINGNCRVSFLEKSGNLMPPSPKYPRGGWWPKFYLRGWVPKAWIHPVV